MICVDILQGSPEWFQEKLGKPSASRFNEILTTSGAESKQREGYLYELAAQAVSGLVVEGFKSPAMVEGSDREAESRSLYEMARGVEVKQVGVIYKDEGRHFLCSPDGIIDETYGLELKNVLPKTMVKYLLAGNLPSDYYQQIQGGMYITGFGRWDFMAYSPGLPPLIIEVHRDSKFFGFLAKALDDFVVDLHNVVKQLRALA